MSISGSTDQFDLDNITQSKGNRRGKAARAWLSRSLVVVLGGASLSVSSVVEPAVAAEQGMGWYLSNSFGGGGGRHV